MDDLSVIEQVKRGNRQAFEGLVRRYQQPLFHYLGRMGLAPEAVEDLVQDSFLRAFRHLSSFDPARARFSTWLFTIARRLAINAAARRRQTLPHLEAEVLPDGAPGAEDRYHRAEIRRRIAEALGQLPVKYRSPLALAYLGDFGVADIARVEGCSEGTVKSRIHRGKQRLKPLLADLMGDKNHA